MKSERILGIISCYSLSDQILHLIERDEEIDQLLIINNPEGLRFFRKLGERSVATSARLIAEDQLPLRRTRGFSVILWFNPAELHNNPADLQHSQSQALSKLSTHVDSVLFCYGLCRSSEQRIMDLMKHALVAVTFLTDYAGEIVDDCFAAILGGKRDYLECIKKHKGTLFASTGYAETWREKYREMDVESIVREVEGLKHMFDSLGYCQVLVLDDGLGDREKFEQDIQVFARVFDLELAMRRCGSKVFERSYDLAKLKIERRRVLDSEGMVSGEPSMFDTLP